MKRIFVLSLCTLIALTSFAQEDEIVEITSFEEPTDTPIAGGQVSFALIDQFNPDDGVEPYDGDWHMLVEYDTSLGQWSWADLDFPEPVDISGMRYIHVWAYFMPDAQPNADDELELRLSLDGAIGIALGYNPKPKAEVAGQWVEYTWAIDTISSENDLSELTGINLSIMPGEAAASGMLFIDNIYASRPADFPDEFEYVTVYNFDEEGVNAAPVGWESQTGEAFIGVGDIEPSEGTNYMEIYIGGGWSQDARTTDAKGASDKWAEAIDILMDVRISDEFTGGWLLLNPVFQSGGEDADGNPLEPVNGWDSYGERDIRWSGFLGEWKTIAWPFRADQHMGALGEDGWFQLILVTNQDAAEAGKRVFVDNLRLAIPAETDVKEWSIY